MQQADKMKKEFIPKLLDVGEVKFYRFLILYAMNKLISVENGTYKGSTPEIDFLDYHDQFLAMYRKEGETVLLDLAKIFRRAGHYIYLVMLKREMTNRNNRFLNLVVA